MQNAYGNACMCVCVGVTMCVYVRVSQVLVAFWHWNWAELFGPVFQFDIKPLPDPFFGSRMTLYAKCSSLPRLCFLPSSSGLPFFGRISRPFAATHQNKRKKMYVPIYLYICIALEEYIPQMSLANFLFPLYSSFMSSQPCVKKNKKIHTKVH